MSFLEDQAESYQCFHTMGKKKSSLLSDKNREEVILSILMPLGFLQSYMFLLEAGSIQKLKLWESFSPPLYIHLFKLILQTKSLGTLA